MLRWTRAGGARAALGGQRNRARRAEQVSALVAGRRDGRGEEEEMSEAVRRAGADEPGRAAPRLNERILSSLSRRSVAAHPWHDLEIGEDFFLLLFSVTARSGSRG